MYTWEFARLQYTAKLNNWTPFISMQPFYNLLYREEEREMLPFCKETGVGVIPWSPIARGILARPRVKEGEKSSSAREQVDARTKVWFADANLNIIDAVEKVAKDRGISMVLIATAWVLSKGCWPIIGLTSEKRVEEIVKALEVKLTDEELKFLESGYKPRSVQM